MKNQVKSMLGYTSPHDLISTVLGFKAIFLNTFLSIVFTVTTFITDYIWDDAAAIYTLGALIMGDWVLGVGLALRATILLKYRPEKLSKEDTEQLTRRKFSSARAPRIVVSMVLSFYLLSMSWNLSKHNYIFIFMPPFVYGGLAGTYFVSLIENVAECGVGSKEMISVLKEKLNPLNWTKNGKD